MLQWRGNVNGGKPKKAAVFPLKPAELTNAKARCVATGGRVTITYNEGWDELRAALLASGLTAGQAGSTD